MDTLGVNLSAAIVDLPIAENLQIEVKINFLKSLGILHVDNIKQGICSIHRFFIKDASLFGFGDPYNLSQNETTKVLALSCSLNNPIIFFTPVDFSYNSAFVEFGVISFQDESNGIMTNIIKKSLSFDILHKRQIDLQEKDILMTASHLLSFRLFDRHGDREKTNILEAIESYRKALSNIDISTRYISLYIALEKAVLADKPKLDGQDFDNAASDITKIPTDDFDELRSLGNRLKHPLRNNNDLTAISDREENLRELIIKLKHAVDITILYRIGLE
jgi:hypothetical protein